jgi:uncharacterized protein YndB with AHSA1/START domain
MPTTHELTVGTPSDLEITLTRAFDAPIALVWEAFNDPRHLPHWMGPAQHTMTTCEIDLRVGGAYRYAWDVRGHALVISGEYLEIDEPNRVVWTESMSDVPGTATNELTLTEEDGVTTTVITTKFASKEARDGALGSGMADGVGEGYTRLDALLPTLA